MTYTEHLLYKKIDELIALRESDRIVAETTIDRQERKIERLTNLLITHYNDTSWFEPTASVS